MFYIKIKKERNRGGLSVVNKNNINLQDVFLNQVRKEHIPVTIYLTNGFQLKGTVKGFDNFTVVLDSEGRQQLIYKHAISTISPMKIVSLIFNDNNRME
ncbi:RNA chaperone Hfq [Acetivibrio straminisolvens]|jgi:host factor-I protein|uniref:RNA chaperone Hfq n=1 Tax=Acetivibrio straminisolvens TaxID=253314 RepID=UPI0023DFC444|nr:RNA chaperone Hfq [Acetivibrio straminisolvens]